MRGQTGLHKEKRRSAQKELNGKIFACNRIAEKASCRNGHYKPDVVNVNNMYEMAEPTLLNGAIVCI